jgi:hypothetical protein
MARAGGRPAVEIEGAKEVRRALKQMGDDLADLKDLHAEVGELVASEARSIAPHDSGDLSGSIRTARRAAGSFVLAGSRRVPYAGPIHFGWRARNIEPQPFLYEAIDSRRDAVIRRYREGIDRITDDAKRRMRRTT